MKTIGRQFLPPHFPPTSICVHMLVFCAHVGKMDLCSGLSILILSELGSVPSYLRDTTSATLPLSLLHHPFLSLSDNSISTQTWRNFSHLKTKTRNAVPPRLFCQLCLYFNNKITLKNCLYICRLQALLFLLNSLHESVVKVKSQDCMREVLNIELLRKIRLLYQPKSNRHSLSFFLLHLATMHIFLCAPFPST